MNLSKRLERLEASLHTYEDDPFELLATGKHPFQELIIGRLKKIEDRGKNKNQREIVKAELAGPIANYD
jgi:hypothetical protein